MRNIYRHKDDLYYVINITDNNNNPLLVSDLHALKMQFFTSSTGKYIEYDKDDCVDNILRINADDLADLPDGPLKVRFLISLADQNYTDGSYDISAERLTGYFLKTIKQQKQSDEVNENDTEGGAS